MAIHFRRAPMFALVGMLALGGASVAQAQDTTSATRPSSDTAGYQPSNSGTDTSMAGRDSTMQHGAPADTALKAAPGTQTGKAANDSLGQRSLGHRRVGDRDRRLQGRLELDQRTERLQRPRRDRLRRDPGGAECPRLDRSIGDRHARQQLGQVDLALITAPA